MDIGWYKENKALQAELRREYPAVAELIDELEQQLAELQSELSAVCTHARVDISEHKDLINAVRVAVHRMIQWRYVAADQNKAEKLEQQLAHKQEQCDQLAHEVLELEQQLSRYQSKYNNLLAVAHRDGGHYLAQHGEEKAGEAAITAILTAYHSNDRYQGGVEVDGEMFGAQGIRLYSPINDDHAKTSRKRVRVLVMEVE